MLRVQLAPSDSLFKALRSHDLTRSQVWREIERLGCGLAPRDRNVMRSEPGFRPWIFRLYDEIKEKVGELTLWVCQRLNVDEPRLNTLEDVDLPIITDPCQWAQPVNDRCGPATFPSEHKWVFVYSPWKSRTLEMGLPEKCSRPWMRTIRQFPSSAPTRSSNAPKDSPVQGPDSITMVEIRGHYRRLSPMG